jgi:hypothetical protein
MGREEFEWYRKDRKGTDMKYQETKKGGERRREEMGK